MDITDRSTETVITNEEVEAVSEIRGVMVKNSVYNYIYYYSIIL